MKLTPSRLLGIFFIIIAIYFFSNSLHNRNLPSGKITQTESIPLDTPEASSNIITGRPQVEFTTSKGKFTIELRPDLAENSVINFIKKWAFGYCNSLTFHRVEDWVVQGCDPKGNGTGGEDILPTETSGENFVIGSVGVARKPYPRDISNDSQFFIVKQPSSFLDNEYTYLGQVTSGMDVVNSISVGDTILSTEILTK
jgi:cyclophilin family peptidyl-prolyl cis-trans isomerase